MRLPERDGQLPNSLSGNQLVSEDIDFCFTMEQIMEGRGYVRDPVTGRWVEGTQPLP